MQYWFTSAAIRFLIAPGSNSVASVRSKLSCTIHKKKKGTSEFEKQNSNVRIFSSLLIQYYHEKQGKRCIKSAIPFSSANTQRKFGAIVCTCSSFFFSIKTLEKMLQKTYQWQPLLMEPYNLFQERTTKHSTIVTILLLYHMQLLNFNSSLFAPSLNCIV